MLKKVTKYIALSVAAIATIACVTELTLFAIVVRTVNKIRHEKI